MPMRRVKLFRRTHRILAGHRISHEKNFDRMRFALDPDQLFHQLVVDVQSSGGIDQKRVIANVARMLVGFARQRQRIVRLRLVQRSIGQSPSR